MMKLKIGIVGVGHLGRIHIRCLQQAGCFDLVGFYDSDKEQSQKIKDETGLKSYPDLPSLIQDCDAIDVVAPTSHHFDIAAAAIQAGKHVFIEKPVTQTVEQARKLVEMVQGTNSLVQIGHVERFNPALKPLREFPVSPKFIEVHRLSPFNPRGTDVSVVLDLMIHDLDIILHWVDSPIISIQANGVPVVSPSADIANARIEFENGCVANLTASRISLKKMRKMRMFQKDAYISIDFLEKQTQIINITDDGDGIPLEIPEGKKYINIQMPDIREGNAIQEELEAFADSVLKGAPIQVPLSDGLRALDTAHRIITQIDERLGALDKD